MGISIYTSVFYGFPLPVGSDLYDEFVEELRYCDDLDDYCIADDDGEEFFLVGINISTLDSNYETNFVKLEIGDQQKTNELRNKVIEKFKGYDLDFSNEKFDFYLVRQFL